LHYVAETTTAALQISACNNSLGENCSTREDDVRAVGTRITQEMRLRCLTGVLGVIGAIFVLQLPSLKISATTLLLKHMSRNCNS